MRIGPDIWGPHAWKFLHLIALAYPDKPSEDDKKHYKDFYELLKFMLPCSICANHFKENIELYLPINDEVLKNRDNFVKWSIDLHNLVNKQTGKSEIPLEEALQLIYNNFQDPKLQANIQTEIDSNNKNIEFKVKINKDNKNISKEIKNKDKSESGSFYSFSFLLVIFLVLITIAIVYKKDINIPSST
jgi:hypothetical protein